MFCLNAPPDMGVGAEKARDCRNHLPPPSRHVLRVDTGRPDPFLAPPYLEDLINEIKQLNSLPQPGSTPPLARRSLLHVSEEAIPLNTVIRSVALALILTSGPILAGCHVHHHPHRAVRTVAVLDAEHGRPDVVIVKLRPARDRGCWKHQRHWHCRAR